MLTTHFSAVGVHQDATAPSKGQGNGEKGRNLRSTASKAEGLVLSPASGSWSRGELCRMTPRGLLSTCRKGDTSNRLGSMREGLSAEPGPPGGKVQSQLSETSRDSTHTWSVSVIIWIGQAASVFHRKLTTHSQLRENMGWVF